MNSAGKRRGSQAAMPCTGIQSPITRKRKSQLSNDSEQPANIDTRNNVEQPQLSRTPQRPKKRVRFSDPGPQSQNILDEGSTGLTPALLRTSFEGPDSTLGDASRTPSRRIRRRSTPILQSRRTSDSLCPFEDVSSQRVIQFTPLRQLLDSRTRRRIQRAGLSDEMNHIDREKRGDSNYKKIMQALLDERDALRTELETTRKPRCSEDGIFNRGTSSNDSNADTTIGGDTMMDDSGIEGDTILASDSPDMRGINRCQSPIPECLSLNDAQLGGDGAHAHTHNQRQDSEAITLSLDLEAARKEKNDLFNACRAHLPSLEHTAIGDSLRCSSPPPDFLSQILPTLTTALTRASDATESLESVRQELSNLGFAGHNVEDVLFALRSQFRSARLELERLIPGETANAGLEDGNATLGALVKRVEILLKRLDEERKRHDGSVGRETALRGQFNTLLVRYEVSRKKIRNLEEMVSSSGRNLLHTRRQMHDLEQENREQAVGIDRLNTALTKYHEEVKSLEAVVTRLEDENVTCNENHQQQISELEETIEENRIRVCDLTAQVESLERQRQKAIESAEQRSSEQLNRHENEIGSMNVRVSELSTSLDATRSEAEKLRQTNAGLEEQLQLEIGARDDLLDNWAADQARSFAYMKETVQANRRRAKARAANWELRSDDIQSDNTNIGSEPITPVSMTRFVDVEVGRGKSRRRVDSGIGILSEDMFDDDVQVDLPSDPANL